MEILRDMYLGESMSSEAIEVEGFKVEKMPSTPAKENPFLHDLYHMGTQLGSNIMAMFANHSDKEMKYLILINCDTGKRIKIRMN